MKYTKYFIIALSMILLTSCGSKEETETSVAESSVVVTTEEKEEETTATAEKTTTVAKSTKAEKTTEKSEKTTETTIAETSGSSAAKTSSTAKPKTTTSAAENNSNDNNNNDDNNVQPVATTESEKPSATKKTSVSATTTASSATTTEAVTEPAKIYDAEYNLSETPYITITSAGDYVVRGTAENGQIFIDADTEDKIELTLDGIDLHCSDSAAILINQSKKCTIKLAEGSVNYLSDDGKDKTNDGVIFSNDTIRIKGKGTLDISAGNAHGIASDDDIIIESGTYFINAKKSGLFAHDDITVNSGDFDIRGGTNGIKSKGTVNINGGNMHISGGSKEEKSSIYAELAFFYSGGNVYAAGNKVTAPQSTPNPYVVLNYVNGAGAENTVSFATNGAEIGAITPHKDFRCVLILSPDINVGDIFASYLNGNASEDFEISEGQNLFEIK